MKLPWRRGSESSDPQDVELRNRLTREQYRVTQKGGTERPFTGEYDATKDDGTYRCVVCGAALFDSADKFDSGTGWPSFTGAIDDASVRRLRDRKLGMLRIEARCADCDAHLGHVFPDGPAPTGERYCMNSASLHLQRADDSTPTPASQAPIPPVPTSTPTATPTPPPTP